MDYEKKHKEEIVRATQLWECGDITRENLEYIFPELKESEDECVEKIKKDIISYLNNRQITSIAESSATEKWLAWLEKQGKPDARYKNVEELLEADAIYQMAMNDAMVEEAKNKAIGALYGLEISKLLGLEKEDEQKPTDKDETKFKVGDKIKDCNYKGEPIYEIQRIDNQCYICKYIGDKNLGDRTIMHFSINNPYLRLVEKNPADKEKPKFHEGDWIISNDKKSTYQIIEVKRGIYVIRDNADNHEYYIGIEACERSGRLWNISDAKDGDVVVDKSDGTIGIFQSIGHHPDGGSCNDTSYCFLHCRYDDGFFYADFEDGNTIDSDDLIPATKEQRNLLFQKMEEAGYMWNVNKKKELKKIEKMPSWSEEDGK